MLLYASFFIWNFYASLWLIRSSLELCFGLMLYSTKFQIVIYFVMFLDLLGKLMFYFLRQPKVQKYIVLQ